MRSGPATVWPRHYLSQTLSCFGLFDFRMQFLLVPTTDGDYENETWAKRLRWGAQFHHLLPCFFSYCWRPPFLRYPSFLTCLMKLLWVVLGSCSVLKFYDFLQSSPSPHSRCKDVDTICGSTRRLFVADVFGDFSPLKIDLKLLEDLRIKIGENMLFSSVKIKFSCFSWNQYRHLSKRNLKIYFQVLWYFRVKVIIGFISCLNLIEE